MSGNLSDPSLKNLLELAICQLGEGSGISSVLEGSAPAGLSGARTAVARRGDRTFYEAAIPWEALKPGFKPGVSPSPGFNFAFCDNDGSIAPGAPAVLKGYQKALQFNSGIADRKSAADAALLIFQSKKDGKR
jgi:hypothetical protein